MSEILVNTIKKADGTGSLTVPAETGTVVLKDGSNDVTLNDITAGGIYLGGTGSANKLEDYEEGTWTPTYECVISSPTITYSSQTSGTYQKIGRTVFVTGRIRTVSVSGGSGSIFIGGLPFAVTSGVDGTSATQETTGAIPVCQCDGWSGKAPKVIEVGTSNLTLFTASSSDFQTSTLNTAMNATDFSSGGVNRIRFAGFYLTDS